jgi:hypothetical protein
MQKLFLMSLSGIFFIFLMESCTLSQGTNNQLKFLKNFKIDSSVVKLPELEICHLAFEQKLDSLIKKIHAYSPLNNGFPYIPIFIKVSASEFENYNVITLDATKSYIKGFELYTEEIFSLPKNGGVFKHSGYFVKVEGDIREYRLQKILINHENQDIFKLTGDSLLFKGYRIWDNKKQYWLDGFFPLIQVNYKLINGEFKHIKTFYSDNGLLLPVQNH